MATPRTVSFATCNLYNLHLPGRPMYRDADGWTVARYEAKLEWLAHWLRAIDADVWGFQELWSGAALTAAFERAGLGDHYDLLVPPGHDGGSIVCAAAVRRSLLDGTPRWIEDFPAPLTLASSGDDPQTPPLGVDIRGFSRPVLRLAVRPRPAAAAIEVFVVHLKSKRPTEVHRERWYREATEHFRPHAQALGSALSTIRRTAEAAALRIMLNDLTRGTDVPVVLMGDLNDGQLSNTQAVLTGDPSYLASGQTLGGSDFALYSTGSLQNYRSQRDVYYTYLHDREKHESLDHILVSQEFFDNAKRRVWAFAGLEVYNDHLNFPDHKDNGTTDHGIVKASFTYRPR